LDIALNSSPGRKKFVRVQVIIAIIITINNVPTTTSITIITEKTTYNTYYLAGRNNSSL